MDFLSNPEGRNQYIKTLKNSIRTQSLTGGALGPGREYGSGGNYWTRANWEHFTSETKSILVGMDVSADEVDQLIASAESNIEFY